MNTNGHGDPDEQDRMGPFAESLRNNADCLRTLWRRNDFLRDDLAVCIFEKPMDGTDEAGNDLVMSELRVMKREDLLRKARECGVSRGVVEAVQHDPDGERPLLAMIVQFPGARSDAGDVGMLRLPAPPGGGRRRPPGRRRARRPR
jgi:hypothetical protein